MKFVDFNAVEFSMIRRKPDVETKKPYSAKKQKDLQLTSDKFVFDAEEPGDVPCKLYYFLTMLPLLAVLVIVIILVRLLLLG